ENGKEQGFDVELVQALGENLGRPIECVNLAFDALPAELASGRIDVICSGMSYTAERAEKVDFSRPYAGSPMWVLVSTSRTKPDATIESLAAGGMQIAVQRGTTGETKARARFPKAEFLVFGTQAEAGNTVATGRADVFVYDKMTIESLHQEHADATRI